MATTEPGARDRQRALADPSRKWYRLARWQTLRLAIFVRHLFTCRMCGRIEPDTSQLVCDHKERHRGDERLFWDEANLQCLCKPCHDSLKQREDRQRDVERR